MRTKARLLLVLVLPVALVGAPAKAAPSRSEEAAGPEASASPPLSAAAIAKRQAQARAARERGRTLAAQGQPVAALAAYRQALLAWPAYPVVHNEIGALLFARGDVREAMASFRKATELDPELTAAWANLAEAERRQGQPTKAVRHLRRALALAPDDAGLYYGLAAAYLDAKDEPKALWAIDRFLERAPSHDTQRAKAALARRQDLAERGVEPAAAPVIAAAEATPATAEGQTLPPELPPVTPRPGEPPALTRHLGDRYFATQRYVEALEAYRQDLEKHPRDVTLLYKVGATHAVMGAYRAAARWWRLALGVDPGRALIARHLGLLALRERAAEAPAAAGDPLAAARADLLSDRPAQAAGRLRGVKGAEAAYLRAEAALGLGEYEVAKGIFQALLKLHPRDVAATGGLAVALTLLGDPKAEDTMQRWLGDQLALPEDFLVLRAAEAVSRIQAGPQAVAPKPEGGRPAGAEGADGASGVGDDEDFEF